MIPTWPRRPLTPPPTPGWGGHRCWLQGLRFLEGPPRAGASRAPRALIAPSWVFSRSWGLWVSWGGGDVKPPERGEHPVMGPGGLSQPGHPPFPAPHPQGKRAGSVPVPMLGVFPAVPCTPIRLRGVPWGVFPLCGGGVLLPAGQRTLHHRGDVLETLVLLNPSDKSLCDEVSLWGRLWDTHGVFWGGV